MRGWVAVLYLWFCTWFPTAPLPLDLRSLGGARQDDLPHEVFEQRLAEVFVRPRPRELHLAAALLREYVCVCVCVRVRACVCVSHSSATPNHPTQTPKACYWRQATRRRSGHAKLARAHFDTLRGLRPQVAHRRHAVAISSGDWDADALIALILLDAFYAR